MIESIVDIATPAGTMDAFVTHPAENGPFPAVVVFMDVWGLREELFDIARKIAVVGFHCTVPNMYYRQGRVRFDYRDERGRMRSFSALPVADQERVRNQRKSLTDEMPVEDVRSVLDFLAPQRAVKDGPKGSLGYCLGGRHAFCVAGAYPDDFRASASLHGTYLVSDGPLSADKHADKYRGEIYCGFAEHDEYAAPPIVAALATALEGRPNVRYRYRVHPGATHGYALPDRDIFNKQAANRDWEIIFAMFRRVLGG